MGKGQFFVTDLNVKKRFKILSEKLYVEIKRVDESILIFNH